MQGEQKSQRTRISLPLSPIFGDNRMFGFPGWPLDLQLQVTYAAPNLKASSLAACHSVKELVPSQYESKDVHWRWLWSKTFLAWDINTRVRKTDLRTEDPQLHDRLEFLLLP